MGSRVQSPNRKRATLTNVFEISKSNIESLKGRLLRWSELLRQDVAKERSFSFKLKYVFWRKLPCMRNHWQASFLYSAAQDSYTHVQKATVKPLIQQTELNIDIHPQVSAVLNCMLPVALGIHVLLQFLTTWYCCFKRQLALLTDFQVDVSSSAFIYPAQGKVLAGLYFGYASLTTFE